MFSFADTRTGLQNGKGGRTILPGGGDRDLDEEEGYEKEEYVYEEEEEDRYYYDLERGPSFPIYEHGCKSRSGYGSHGPGPRLGSGLGSRPPPPGLYAHDATPGEISRGTLRHVSELSEAFPVDVVEIIDPSTRSRWFPLFLVKTDWRHLSWYVYDVMNRYFTRTLHSVDERLCGEGQGDGGTESGSYVRFQYRGITYFALHNEARHFFDEVRLKHPLFDEPIELFACWSTWAMIIHCARRRRFSTNPNDMNVYLTRYDGPSSSFDCCKNVVTYSEPPHVHPYSGLIGSDPPRNRSKGSSCFGIGHPLSLLRCRRRSDTLKMLLIASCVFFTCIIFMLYTESRIRWGEVR